MGYREITLAFAVVAVLATVLAFSGTASSHGDGPVLAASPSERPASGRGYLGLVARPGGAIARGAVVDDVIADGPAHGAGIRPGDVIIAFDGRPVLDGDDLRDRVAATRPGTPVTLAVTRDGTELRVALEIGERPGRITGATRVARTLAA
jgi:S1-C subfamily serine protease